MTGDHLPIRMIIAMCVDFYDLHSHHCFFSSSLATKAMKFHPSPQVPALQYVGSVEEGGAADLAGLRTGEFIIEVYNHHKLALLHIVLYNNWCVKIIHCMHVF